MLKKPDLQNKKIGREDNNMIIENAIEKLEARIKCAEQLKRGLCNDNDCVNCKIGYEQGTVEEQIEALKAAVNALQDQLNTENKGENNMLTLVSINKKVQEELKKCGYESEEITLVKNGLEKKGLKIENGCICPIIYPVDMVKAGKTIDSIVQFAIKECKESYLKNIPEKIIDWNTAKDHLQLCVQKSSNEEIIKIPFLDLEVYVRVIISKGDQKFSHKVNKNDFPGINENEIFARAIISLRNNFCAKSLGTAIREMGGFINNDQSGLIYLSNKDNYYGAAVIYIKDFLRDMAQKFESDLVILPSSIHEALCYADNNWREEKDKINAMVKEVNNTMVSPEEILSNHAYFYNKATDQIEW